MKGLVASERRIDRRGADVDLIPQLGTSRDRLS